MSRGQFQRRTDYRKRPLEKCKSKGKNSVVIDVDNDKITDFIIIDPPESSGPTFHDGSRKGEKNIIYLDGDDERVDFGSLQNYAENVQNKDSHSASSSKAFPVPNESIESQPSSCDVRKPSSYFTPSTSYSNYDSDSDIAEDYLGNIREQWYKASLKKKIFENAPKVDFDSQDGECLMRFSTVSPSNVDVNYATESLNFDACVNKTAEVPMAAVSSNKIHRKTNMRQSVCTDAGISSKSDGDNQYADLKVIAEQGKHHQVSVGKTQDANESDPKMPEMQFQEAANPPVPASNGVEPFGVQDYIIGGREMLKKSDAYKRAEEEEWASRLTELKIQAEEARRLRKRKKAETLRLMEMERRQKQRLEEVREANKKDEETLNLKEQLRVEVRRELERLEANCRDMASLLRGLGIDIGGGPCPSSSEVRLAYKQALLKFHPDRASRTDIRQHIEAEEKFKLISRAKEKFNF